MDEANCDLCCCVRRRVHKNINTATEIVGTEVFGNQTSGIDDRKQQPLGESKSDMTDVT